MDRTSEAMERTGTASAASEPATIATLKIGDLARRASKSARALRLYEDMGLLGPAVRTDGGHRLYSNDAVLRLQWIDRLQTLGLSLPEIRSFLDRIQDARTGPRAMADVHQMFVQKLATVRAQMEALRAVEADLVDGIAYLETCHGCRASAGLDHCKVCDQSHPVDEPLLIRGIHRNGEGR
ncbi:MAG: MerR family transcriptional regulator [Myxococcales bacterium]|nr:MerR family transcriptional regulator [Myxococcales bacterium]